MFNRSGQSSDPVGSDGGTLDVVITFDRKVIIESPCAKTFQIYDQKFGGDFLQCDVELAHADQYHN